MKLPALSSAWLPKYVGLGLASGSVLALQVAFTRIFSIMIWYHFTYLIVGVALLGGGAAGTYLAVRRWDKATIQRRLGRVAAAFSLSILATLLVINLIAFDPLSSQSSIIGILLGLVVYFVAMLTTFFLGGLTVAGAFSLWSSEAHRLYFADLLGASGATLAIVVIVQLLGGPGAVIFIALMAMLAAYCFSQEDTPNWKRGLLAGVGAQALLLIIFTTLIPIQLFVPESKELGFILRQFDLHAPEYTRWNPVARVDVTSEQVVDQPFIVGGVSSTYWSEEHLNSAHSEDTLDVSSELSLRFVTLDGTSMTILYPFDGDLTPFHFLEHSVVNAPYLVSSPQPSVLNIGVGGGVDIILAMLHDASAITAIDINTDVVELLEGPYREYTGGLIDDPRVEVIAAEGRSFLIRNEQEYDIIQGIGLDNFAALSGGAYVLSESYLYTVEAVETALMRLSPDGIFSWTREVNNPPREMLRLTGLAAEALRRAGISDPSGHVAVVSNPETSTATLLISRSPFGAEAIANLREWSDMNKFEMLQDPLIRLDTLYHEYLTTDDPKAFEADYPYNIYPVYDDNPFFYNYFKWLDFRFNLGQGTGNVNTRFPIGNIILLTMLTLSLLAAAAFILVPLFRNQRAGLKTPHALPTLSYFSLLGAAYIFVEIVLIQRFTLFIGYPTHAISTTIFSMLLFSAIGSLVAQRIVKTQRQLQVTLVVVAVLIVVYIAALPLVFEALLTQPDGLRIALSVVIIAPLAFVMGMPFPTGLRQISTQADNLVPWAWGMNGVFSVVGSVLVVVTSMITNFTIAMTVATVLYAAAALVATALWKAQVIHHEKVLEAH